MANEIRLVTKMNLAQGNFTYVWNPGLYLPNDELFYNLTGSPNSDSGLQTCTTSGTNFTLTNVTTAGYVGLRNTDSTNYIDIGYDDSGTLRDLIRLKAGEVCMFRLQPARTIRGKANTASVIVEYMIFQD